MDIANYDIEKLIGNFTQEAENAQNLLSNLLKGVTNGQPPTLDEISELGSVLKNLHAKYQNVRSVASSILDTTELPEAGCPVKEYLEAIQKSQRQQLKTKLEEVGGLINRFTAITSQNEDSVAVLKPIQDDAVNIFRKVESSADIDAWTRVIESAEKYRSFIRAVDMSEKQLDSPEGITLLEDLMKFYPPAVVFNINRGRYYITENKTFLVEGGASKKIETTEPSEHVDDVLYAKNPLKKWNYTTKTFEGDIIKDGARRGINVFILPLFTNFALLTARQVRKMCAFYGYGGKFTPNHNNIPQALDWLTEKGCFAVYEFGTPAQDIYCLTHGALSCMSKETIRNRKWPVSIGKYVLTGEERIEKSLAQRIFSNNETLLKALYALKSTMNDRQFRDKVMPSIVWKDTCFSLTVPWGDVDHRCCLMDSFEKANAVVERDVLVLSDEDIGEREEKLAMGRTCLILNRNGLRACGAKTSEAVTTDESMTQFSDANSGDVNRTSVNPESTVEQGEPVSAAVQRASTQGAVSLLSPTEPHNISENDFNDVLHPSTGAKKLDDALVEDHTKTVADVCRQILNINIKPSDEQFEKLIQLQIEEIGPWNSTESIEDRALVRAVLLAKAASLEKGYSKSKQLYEQLILASGVPFDNLHYTGTVLSNAFENDTAPGKSAIEGMQLAAWLHALIFPWQAHDYTLRARAKRILSDYDTIYPSYATIKPLFSEFCAVAATLPGGFTDTVLSFLGDKAERKKFLEKFQQKASILMNAPSLKIRITGLPNFVQNCFGNNSDLANCMGIIAQNKVEDKELVQAVLSEYCDSSETVISEDLINMKLDREWDIARSRKNKPKMKLAFDARRKVFDAFLERLTLMMEWGNIEEVDDNRCNHLRSLRAKTLNDVNAIFMKSEELKAAPGNVFVLKMLKVVHDRLSGHHVKPLFMDLLTTRFIPLDNEGNPILTTEQCAIPYYEPWRNVLRHIASPARSLNEARQGIFDNSAPDETTTFDNLNQLELIDRAEGKEIQVHDDITAVQNSAEKRLDSFKGQLELAYTYGRIREDDKENLTNIQMRYKPDFFDGRNFGCWRQFLNALEQKVTDLTAERKKQLKNDIKIRRANLDEKQKTFSTLDKAEKLLDEDNFAVAEEYINRFDYGEYELTKELQTVMTSGDSFRDFLSDESFDPLYDLCSRNSSRKLGDFSKDLDKARPKDWSSRLKTSSEKLVEAWPSRRGKTTTDQIKTLFFCLGFNVIKAEKIDCDQKAPDQFKVFVQKSPRNASDYDHPIAAFGTKMASPLSVVILYGNHMADGIVKTVTALNLNPNGIAVVLVDYYLDRGTRRQVAEIFHTQTSGQKPFLLIDRVLALHLALHLPTERLSILLKCTLPYTIYQPFVSGVGAVSDEMFFGRRKEIHDITDPNGASIVYGGRQLGKTALLQRAENLRFAPENGAFAVLSTIKEFHKEEQVVEHVIKDIVEKTNLPITPCASLEDMCRQISSLFRQEKIASFLLLLDETDNFLESIGSVDYNPLLPLVNLKRETQNNFKFVLAGLHNVCRAKNTLSSNNVFGQLGTPLCIQPLSPVDAMDLISRPLHYLGFQVGDAHLQTILINTNYYPGILQFFGYTLVQTLTSKYAQYYHATNNPPFVLNDMQLGNVMADESLNDSIRSRFHLSLNLDQRYFMLARCIALLYYTQEEYLVGDQHGFTQKQISDCAKEYQIYCLEQLSSETTINLLDEMVEMGILGRPESGIYRLRRRSFLNIISHDDSSLLDDIDKANNPEEAVQS